MYTVSTYDTIRYDMFRAFGSCRLCAAVLFPLTINVWLKCELQMCSQNEMSIFCFYTLNSAEFKNYKTSGENSSSYAWQGTQVQMYSCVCVSVCAHSFNG